MTHENTYRDDACILLVWDFSAIWRLFFRLAGAVGRQRALHTENSGLPSESGVTLDYSTIFP
jgi:hypothetical protein